MNSFSTYIIIFILSISSNIIAQKSFHQSVKLMGCKFDITVIVNNEKDSEFYHNLAISEIKRIEKLISSWDNSSQTSEININAGIRPTKVDLELYNLIERAISISKITDGAFDISYASMDRIWRFDGSMTKMPTKEIIAKSISKVGYRNIILNKKDRTVYLKKKGMKIGFGAIGKGYAADKAKSLLIKNGVKSGIINASGDMSTWGKQSNGDEWNIAITNPLNKNKVYALLPISDGAVVTSGNYEKYVVFDNVRYTHIIDPRTGYPSTEVISATVFANKAELADALATSIFIMGTKAGLDRINQLPNIECIIINKEGNIFSSDNIKIKKH